MYLKLLLGLGLGYTLIRATIGFAGSVNKAYRTGSTQLMRTLMLMFVLTAVANVYLILQAPEQTYNLWINPINFGLVIGAMLFGFGMSFSSCCASGVMTSLLTDLPRGVITLLFFSLGVFLGYPIQKNATWVSDTLVSTKSYPDQGVYLPDLIPTSGSLKYIGALAIILMFAGIVIFVASRYERYRKSQNTFLPSENNNDDLKHQSPLFYRLFIAPWSMLTGALVITIIFTVMMVLTKNGWGASGAFGLWFGKLLIVTGFSPEQVGLFTDRPATMFTRSLASHSTSVQNFGIMMGALICVLLAGKFTYRFNYSLKQISLFAVGGLLMGLGTRFANGCNVGALYTPIANLSLSGWLFLVFIILGGILGNKLGTRIG